MLKEETWQRKMQNLTTYLFQSAFKILSLPFLSNFIFFYVHDIFL